MARFEVVETSKIIVGERRRAVNDGYVAQIADSISKVGLLNPITVRRTPPNTKPYLPWTLVAGAHRLDAMKFNGVDTIEAIVIEATRVEAEQMEIEENLIRNDLSALDRGVFVVRWKELWEKEHGPVKVGRRQQTDETVSKPLFHEQAAERIGLSRRTVELAQFIGSRLAPELRLIVKGTKVADNQSLLKKLAGMPPARQRIIAKALADEPDIKRAIELTDMNAAAKKKRSRQTILFGRLVSTWGRCDKKTRQQFRDFLAGLPADLVA